MKQFRLTKEEIGILAHGFGSCFATDRIVVDGCQVGYMYREQPDNELDSGWRFMAGDENQAYVDEPGNLGLYDVNTIANYDPEIIPFLIAPVGNRFERREGGPLQMVSDP